MYNRNLVAVLLGKSNPHFRYTFSLLALNGRFVFLGLVAYYYEDGLEHCPKLVILVEQIGKRLLYSTVYTKLHHDIESHFGN